MSMNTPTVSPAISTNATSAGINVSKKCKIFRKKDKPKHKIRISHRLQQTVSYASSTASQGMQLPKNNDFLSECGSMK